VIKAENINWKIQSLVIMLVTTIPLNLK